MTFNEYWAKKFKPTSQPAAFDMALRELAESAWYAAIAEAVNECNAYGDRSHQNARIAYNCSEVIQDRLGKK